VPVLDPIQSTLDAVRDRLGDGPVRGLVPGLVVADPRGWTPAGRYADGTALPGLISSAQRRWGTAPHVAAALAWKSYAYWVALPAVLGFATGRVPDVSAGNVLIRPHAGPQFVEVGLCRPTVATDHRDLSGGAQAEPGFGGAEHPQRLTGYLRERLLDQHLSPVLEGLHGLVHLGRRTLLGSVASGVAHALVRVESAVPGLCDEIGDTLLGALGVADLVEITPGPAVHRRTCCLAFTLPEPKVCRGCCLTPAP
jgi:hypothetical protein